MREKKNCDLKSKEEQNSVFFKLWHPMKVLKSSKLLVTLAPAFLLSKIIIISHFIKLEAAFDAGSRIDFKLFSTFPAFSKFFHVSALV